VRVAHISLSSGFRIAIPFTTILLMQIHDFPKRTAFTLIL
jgi:hypothetical protein